MYVTLAAIVMLVNPPHSEKALSIIFSPLVIIASKSFGFACLDTMDTFIAKPIIRDKLMHPTKAFSFMFFSPPKMVILVKLMRL